MEKYEILHVVNYPNGNTTRKTIGADSYNEMRMLMEREVGNALILASVGGHLTVTLQYQTVGMIDIKCGALRHTIYLHEYKDGRKTRADLSCLINNPLA